MSAVAHSGVVPLPVVRGWGIVTESDLFHSTRDKQASRDLSNVEAEPYSFPIVRVRGSPNVITFSWRHSSSTIRPWVNDGLSVTSAAQVKTMKQPAKTLELERFFAWILFTDLLVQTQFVPRTSTEIIVSVWSGICGF